MSTYQSSGKGQQALAGAAPADTSIGRPPSITSATESNVPLTGRESAVVDDRQDQLMTRDSVDGRPPTHRQRVTLWMFFAVLGFVVLAAAVVLAVARGVSLPAVALGAILCMMYFLLAVWPAWGAGLLRGTEERAARQQAVLEVRTDGEPEHLPHATDRTV